MYVMRATLWLLGMTLSAQVRFVRADGMQLAAPSGERIILRGVNLENWLVPDSSLSFFGDALADLEQSHETAAFWRDYQSTFIAENDIVFIRGAGFNSVRIPLDYWFVLGGDESFAVLDRLFGWCRKAGLWVILDLHQAPGGHTWPFGSPEDEQKTIAVWRQIALRYRDETVVLGYDLLNEPLPRFSGFRSYSEHLEPLYQRIAAAIRKVDPNHVLILGGAPWDFNFDVLGPPFERNVVYTFHKHWLSDDPESMREYLDFRDRHHVPIWLGSTGESTDELARQFVRVLDNNGIGWYFGPYKKMENGSSVVSFDKPRYWDKIVAYGDRRSDPGRARHLIERMSRERTLESCEDLLAQIRLENCHVNKSYIKALGMKAPE